MLKGIVHKIVPNAAISYLQDIHRKRLQAQVKKFPSISEDYFQDILVNRLQLKRGDIVFIHSSIDKLNLNFPFYRVLALLRAVIGEEGTMLFPTYPKLTSYKFLLSGEVFDVRKTASYTGILTEFARHQRTGIRSLHPTKSVVAIGPLAKELTSTHSISPYPYDSNSPYYKTIELKGKAIGIGVATTNLSLVHCVDDLMKDEFPVQPYHSRLFDAPCVNQEGDYVTVPTYGHDMRKMKFDIPSFISKHISDEICHDIIIDGMKFFRTDTSQLFKRMVELARQGTTIYSQRFYK